MAGTAGTKGPPSAADGFREVLGSLGQITAAPDANQHVMQFCTDLITAISTFLKMPPQGQNMGQQQGPGQQQGQPGMQPGMQGPPGQGMPPGGPGMPQGGMPGPTQGGPQGNPGGGPPGQPPAAGPPGPNGVMPISKITDTDELRRMLASSQNQ